MAIRPPMVFTGGIRGARLRVGSDLAALKLAVSKLLGEMVVLREEQQLALERQVNAAQVMAFKNAQIDRVMNVILGNYGLNAPSIGPADEGLDEFGLPGG